MEMPISAMITLFVAVVVAGSIIFFAKDILFKGGQDIKGIGNTQGEEGETLITLSSVSSSNLYDLAVQCASDVEGSIDKKICFIVKGSFTDISSLDKRTLTIDGKNFTINLNVVDNPNAVFIYYNPLGTIDIES